MEGQEMKTATITIDGTKYPISPPGKAELRQLDKYVLKHRRSTLQLAKDNMEGLTSDQQSMLLKEALKIEASKSPNEVTAVEYGAVMDTRQGCAYLLWLCLKRTHPDITLESVETAIMDATEDEFVKLLEERDAIADDEDEGEDDGEPVKSSG